MNYTNQTSNNDYTIDRFMYIVSMYVIFKLTLIGNICVVLIILYSKYRISKNSKKLCIRLKNLRISFYILSLSIADINVALMSILPQIFETTNLQFYNSNMSCKFVKFIQVFSVYASTYTLLQMGFDRFDCICRPIKSVAWTQSNAINLLVLSYFLSAFFSLPQIIVWSIESNTCSASFDMLGKKNSLHLMRVYVFYHAIAQFFIPLLILCYLYTKIAITVNNMVKSKYMKEDSEIRQHLTPESLYSLNKSKITTFKMTLAIVVTFALCIMPYYTTQVILTIVINPSELAIKIFRK